MYDALPLSFSIAYFWKRGATLLKINKVRLVYRSMTDLKWTVSQTGALSNSVNEANEITKALKHLGFEVITGLDLDRRAFAAKLLPFSRSVEDAMPLSYFTRASPWKAAGRIALPAWPNLISVGLLFGVKRLCPEIGPVPGYDPSLP